MEFPFFRKRLSPRDIMIQEHLIGRGIRDPAVVRAMAEVPREAFVPAEMRDLAYEDYPLPIGAEQTISQPYIVAYMTEALELTPTDRVLEIGTGSGYSAAVLAQVAATVHSVERLLSLAGSAKERLASLGYRNVAVHLGDGTLGWAEQAPYDAIVVTAGAPRVPRPLLEQLAVHGRLVIPVGVTPFQQMLVRVRRLAAEDYQTEELCAVRFVPLIGLAGWRD